MKKSVRIIAVALVAIMLCMALVSCGKKLSGTYEAEVDLLLVSYNVSMKFAGNKVTITETADAILTEAKETVYEGSYEINKLENGKMEITLDLENEGAIIKSGTFDFAETDDGDIKLEGVTYKKQD